MEYAVFLVVGLFVAWLAYKRSNKQHDMLMAAEARVSGRECVACLGTSVTEYFENCYRCDICGFEWGHGQAAHAAHLQSQKLASMDEGERRVFAIAQLTEAKDHIFAAQASLHSADQIEIIRYTKEGKREDADQAEIGRSLILNASAELNLAHKNVLAAKEAATLPVQAPSKLDDLDLDLLLDNDIYHRYVASYIDLANAMDDVVRRGLGELSEAGAGTS